MAVNTRKNDNSQRSLSVLRYLPKLFEIFTSLTLLMYLVMLPMDLEAQNVITSMNDCGPVNATIFRKIITYFSYETKTLGNLVLDSNVMLHHCWIAAVPSLFLSLSIIQFNSSVIKLFTHLYWPFIVTSVWWTLQAIIYLNKSIGFVCTTLLTAYVNEMQWNSKILAIGFFVIYFKLNFICIIYENVKICGKMFGRKIKLT